MRCETSKNKSSGWNAGVSVSFGQDGAAFGLTAGDNKGKGYGRGNSTTYRNTHVGNLTGKTTIIAGNKLTMKGAQALGKGIKVRAKDLDIESLQDKTTFKGRQKNIGGSVTIGAGVSGSVNYGKSNINADHLAVKEQSGIFAGDDGFDVEIANHTDLKGGLITSTAKAEANHNNRFVTGTISTEDIQNHSNYDAKGFGLGVSGGFSADLGLGKHAAAQGRTAKDGKPMPTGKNSINVGKSLGYGSDDDSRSSITTSGIGTANISITDTAKQQSIQPEALNTDTIKTKVTTDIALSETGLQNTFDKDKVQREIDTQVKVTQGFDTTRQGVKQRFSEKLDKLKESGAPQGEIDNLQKASLIVDGIAGALSTPNAKGVMGDVAQVASPQIAKQIGDYFANQPNTAGNKTSHALAHTVLAAAVAAAGGNDAITAGLSAGGGELAAPIVAKYLYGTDKAEKLTAEQKATVSNITGLIGTGAGAATGNISDIIASTNATTNAVDNNWLTHEENELRDKNRKYIINNCSSRWGNLNSSSCKKAHEVVNKLNTIDEIRDDKLYESHAACTRADEEGCRAFVYAHIIQREILNERTYEEFKRDQLELSEDDFHNKWQVIAQDDYHQWDDNLTQNKETVGNIKLQNGGQKEVVVHYGDNSTSYRDYVIVTDPTNAGTYNYGPSKWTNHLGPDVTTYIDFGSGPGDRTTYDDRYSGIADGLSWGDLEDLSDADRERAINTFNRVANECIVNGSNACAEAYENYAANQHGVG